VSFIDL